MAPEETIDILSQTMKDVPAIRALFLSGSHGNGTADAYSDLDFVAVSSEGASDAVADAWREAVGRTGEIVLWWDRTTVPVLINAITRDWTRTDLLILKPDQLRAHAQDSVKVLFDHDGIFYQLSKTRPAPAPEPTRFIRDVEEFIRILGLLHLVDGRKEYNNGVLGVYHLRNLLVELLIAETGAAHRGGILHLNRLITDPQKELLAALPAPVVTRQGIIDAHLAYAAAYLPRARARAKAIGAIWPEPFEAATWEKLHETLGIAAPYDAA